VKQTSEFWDLALRSLYLPGATSFGSLETPL